MFFLFSKISFLQYKLLVSFLSLLFVVSLAHTTLKSEVRFYFESVMASIGIVELFQLVSSKTQTPLLHFLANTLTLLDFPECVMAPIGIVDFCQLVDPGAERYCPGILVFFGHNKHT